MKPYGNIYQPFSTSFLDAKIYALFAINKGRFYQISPPQDAVGSIGEKKKEFTNPSIICPYYLEKDRG